MPINTDLNVAPYFDDFDLTKQYYRLLFKPGFALQARELTQLQTSLQNQVEQFGDNIFKEGSIIKGCNFTEISNLQYVRLVDKINNDGTTFDVSKYVGGFDELGREIFYELEGSNTLLRAAIVAATRGFETSFPDLNTFYINYLNSTNVQVFEAGEELSIIKIVIDESGQTVSQETVNTINVSSLSNRTGRSFGLRASEGVVYQKGHFLYTEEQLVIVSKYSNQPDEVSVGYIIDESIINYLQDVSLVDNANGSPNENAPGADRLKLVPRLVARTTAEAEADETFFTLVKYVDGSAVQVRDVSQYNVIGDAIAKRTYEESGDYIAKPFKTQVIEKDNQLKVSVGPGVAYVKGYRIENRGEYQFDLDDITETEVQQNQPITFNYGGYVSVANSATFGTFTLPSYSTVNLRNISNSNIGTAIVKNLTPNKVYLFGVRMTSSTFANVDNIQGATGFVKIDPVMKESSKSPLIFDSGMFSLKSVTDLILPVRATKAVNIISDAFTLSPDPGEDLAVDNTDMVVVDSNNIKLEILSITSVGSDRLVTLVSGQSPAATATVYYNKRISTAEPHKKVPKETYVLCDYNPANSTYNLGFPDVYEIVEILDTAGDDVTSSFQLYTNQNDHYYDHSYIQYIPGRKIPATGSMSVKLKVFQLNSTVGKYFFTINSYPNDFDADKIPIYKASNGKTYNLRDCIDFRPYVDLVGGADYNISSPGAAPLIPGGINVAPTFTGNIVIPAVNSAATADFEYYLNRTDQVVLDSYGKISLLKGEPSIFSKPSNIEDKMTIAEIYVPGFPAISPARALLENRPQYAAKIKNRGTRVYTMKDIAGIDKKIDRLTYYTLLSSLELATENINIKDEFGNTRFKNGIIVDSFSDLTIADVRNAEFSAAIDFSRKMLTPPVRTYPLNLIVDTSEDVTISPTPANPEVATLEVSSHVSIINQPYATNFRNCVSNFYNYAGTGYLWPEHDSIPDVINNPSIVFEQDFSPVFDQFVDNIQEFVPLTSTREDLIETRNAGTEITTQGRTTITSTTFENIFRDTQRTLQTSSRNVESFVGNFITNVQFSPFMRAREIRVAMYGLRPNTRHYVYFDKENVSSFVAPAVKTTGDNNFGPDAARSVQASGAYGSAVTTNSNGHLFFVFNLPAERFFVGDRLLEVADVDTYSSIESAATSKGFKMYHAYNFSIERAGLTVSTRIPEFSIRQTSSERAVEWREQRVEVDDDGGEDPLAQTFFIKQAVGRGSDTIFLSKADLYFKRKSATQGVTIEIREVINGYPSYEIVPFSKTHLTSAEVSVSDDASVKTEVVFQAPIRLQVEKEYAIVVKPDANDPDYLIYTSKVGGINLENQSPVIQDWGDGVLFTSTNNRAWRSYQDEDIKFTLYRANFSDPDGYVTFKNDNTEFLTITNPIGRFDDGEQIYVNKGSVATVGFNSGNTTITSSGSPPLSLTFTVGDYVLLGGANVVQKIYRVIDVGSTFMNLDGPVIGTVTSGNASATPIVYAKLGYYNYKRADVVSLEESSARVGRSIAAADTIYGLSSGAQATVTSVDDLKFSYMQPFITQVNDSVTSTSMTGTFTDVNDVNASWATAVPATDKTTFNTRGMQIRSKSNDLSNVSPFKIKVNMLNAQNPTTSPVVDIETASTLIYKYIITNNVSTTSKYVSKVIELADDFDAEDFRIYVTGYRPEGTDIKVYIKVQNAADSISFDSNSWIEMQRSLEGDYTFSSTTNLNDFREIVYNVPDANKTAGSITYTNSTGTYSGFKKFAIRIALLSPNIYNVPFVSDYRGIALT